MKRILEYKVFDLLKDQDNVDFLDKVKKENPDLYAQFLSTLGNKGLEIAKKKYQEYDPEFVKSEKLRKKRESTKEFKDKKKENILIAWSDEIKEIENILSSTPLKNIAKYIEDNTNITKYMRSAGYKKKYENVFLQLVKNPFKLPSEFRSRGSIYIDNIMFGSDFRYKSWFGEDPTSFIRLYQFYNIIEKKLTYTIKFGMPDIDIYSIPSVDNNKMPEYLTQRNNYIQIKLGQDKIDIEELYKIINNFSVTLSEEAYKNWVIENDMKKYNM
jgi:hypothetical protein